MDEVALFGPAALAVITLFVILLESQFARLPDPPRKDPALIVAQGVLEEVGRLGLSLEKSSAGVERIAQHLATLRNEPVSRRARRRISATPTEPLSIPPTVDPPISARRTAPTPIAEFPPPGEPQEFLVRRDGIDANWKEFAPAGKLQALARGGILVFRSLHFDGNVGIGTARSMTERLGGTFPHDLANCTEVTLRLTYERSDDIEVLRFVPAGSVLDIMQLEIPQGIGVSVKVERTPGVGVPALSVVGRGP